MQINFYDDPARQPKSREEVRIEQIGLFMDDNQRRVTFGLELTPFLERPCIEVQIVNGLGQLAGALSVIETMQTNFSLIIHLRDEGINDPYSLLAEIYYATPETERMNVDRQIVVFESRIPGEKIFKFND